MLKFILARKNGVFKTHRMSYYLLPFNKLLSSKLKNEKNIKNQFT
jgi:hypothetical protein